ncbi:hypothetical protein C8J56DRAFT_1127431 [Mycena floridula]|nr:hypothetical protein C8J56DRAFT_1127431 [Mycena floridula]
MFRSLQKSIGQVFAVRTKTQCSGSPWLEHLISIANLFMNSSDLLPFPDVKADAGLVVSILQTINDARKNQDEFRELLAGIVGIVSLRSMSRFIYHGSRLLDIMTSLHEHARSTAEWKKYARSAEIRDDIVGYRRAVDEMRDNFLLSAVLQTHRGIEQILDGINSLLAMLGYTWERSSNRVVLLTDLLDVETPIPLVVCQTWETFVGVLTRAERRYIDNGDFNLTSNGSEHIHPTTWNSVVKAVDNIPVARRSTHMLPSCPEYCGKCPLSPFLQRLTVFLQSILRDHVQSFSRTALEDSALFGIQNASSTTTTDRHDSDTRYIRRWHVLRVRKVVLTLEAFAEMQKREDERFFATFPAAREMTFHGSIPWLQRGTEVNGSRSFDRRQHWDLETP